MTTIIHPFTVQPASVFEPSKAGAWADIPSDIYHKLPGDSNSQLAVLGENPLRYRLQMDGLIQRESTHDMEVGTIIHAVVNEGAVAPFHIQPDTYQGKEKGAKKDDPLVTKPWNAGSNTCKAWLAAHKDKTVLTLEEAEMVANAAQCVRADKKASRLMTGAMREVTAVARNPDLAAPYLLRCRFDLLGHDDAGWYFVDTKSCRDASTRAFSYEIRKRQYHAQAAHYKRVLDLLTGEDTRCYIIAIEKDKDVPRVNVRQLSAPALADGAQIVDARLHLLRKCRIANSWPALPDDEGSEHIQMIGLPDEDPLADLEGLTEVNSDEKEASFP